MDTETGPLGRADLSSFIFVEKSIAGTLITKALMWDDIREVRREYDELTVRL